MTIQRRYQWQLIAKHRPGWSMDYIRSMNQEEVLDFFAFHTVDVKLSKKNRKSKS